MFSDATKTRLENEVEARDRKLDKIKEDAKAGVDKISQVAGAFGGGLLYGVLNRRQGGTLDTPYSVAGKLPLDAALAVGGGLLVLMGKDKGGLLSGAASAWLGVYAARYGDTYEQNALGASTSSAATSTTPATSSGAPIRQFGVGDYRHPMRSNRYNQPAYR